MPDGDTGPLTTPLVTTTAAAASSTATAASTVNVDDMLRVYTGEFGRWQQRHFVLTSIAWALNAFHTLVVVFTDREPVGPAFVGPDGSGSTVSEWGLVGKERFKVGLVQSAFFAGSMLGAGIFGHLSDTLLGRKGTLTLTSSMNSFFGILTGLSPSFSVYVVLRFLTGLSTGGLGLSAFVLATEPVGPSKRGPVAMSTFCFFSFGTIILAVAANFVPQWRYLYILSSIPSLVYVIIAVPFISESPRWHFVHHNIPAAMKIMRSIAKTNKKELPDNVLLALDCSTAQKEKDSSTSIVDVFKSPVARKRLTLSVIINFVISIAYYGLTLNVKNLSTNLYISVMLNAVAEIPAYALSAFFVKRCGRRPLIISTMWLATVFCIAASLARNVIRTMCGMMGIFAVTATFNLLFIYTAELFPTTVRNAALGCVSQAGQSGAVVAPMIIVSGRNWPFAIFGLCGLVGGMFGFGLPETLGQPLYETMEGLEKGEEGMGDAERRTDDCCCDFGLDREKQGNEGFV